VADFDKLLEKFDDHKQHLRELGDALVERYPQSKNLVKFEEELSAAIAGLDSLRERLAGAIQEAEQQNNLKIDIEQQMAASELFQSLGERDKHKLSEYLIQNGVGLAKEEEVRAFMAKSFEQKPEEDLLSDFSKAFILELGKQAEVSNEENEFDAYREGLKLLKAKIADPEQKKELVEALATDIMKENPASAIKIFYAKAYQPVQDEQKAPPVEE
jgi:hypothetical protein